MTRREFLSELEEQLEIPVGSLKESDALVGLEAWDSMAAVLFIGLADEKVGVSISGKDISGAKTVDGLLALLGDRLTA